MEGRDEDQRESKGVAKALDLVVVVAILQRVNKENDPESEHHEADKRVMLNEKNAGKSVGVQTDSGIVKQLWTQPGATHDVKVECKEEVPLDPEALDCDVTFLIFAGSQTHHLVERVYHKQHRDDRGVQEAELHGANEREEHRHAIEKHCSLFLYQVSDFPFVG